MLTKLTQKQEKLFKMIRDKWLNMLFKPETIDINRKESDKGIKWLYKISGLKEPRILYLSSPLGAQICANILNQVGSQVRSQVWGQVWSQVRSQVGRQVRSQVLSQVGSQVGSQVRSQVESQVGRSSNTNFFDFCSYGNILDFGWCAYYDFFRKLKLVKNSKYNRFTKLLEAGIYDMIQLDRLCIVCEKPTMILRDEQNRLHSVSRLAIEWRDGFKLWFIHGIAFEFDEWKKAIDQTYSIQEVFGIKNIEKRYAVLSVYEPNKIIENIEATKISESKKGVLLFSSEKIIPRKTVKFLKYACPSTGRIYISFVPEGMTDADVAMAWKFSLTKELYEELEQEA